jgi:colicin import membrane protein
MRETGADTRTALLQALGLHMVLFAMMFAGLQWTRSNVAEAAKGEVIEADLIDPTALGAAMRSALQRTPEALPQPVVEPEPPPPEPEPAPDPLPEPVPEALPPPVPDPEPVEQEKVQRDAESPEVAKVPREQDEKRKTPEQAELDAQRVERVLAQIRKQREQAARERTMAEQRAQQLADARAQQSSTSNATPAARGNPESRSAVNALYSVALKDAITRQWTRPESIPLGVSCQVRIRQIPGGEVVDVQVSAGCPYDQVGKRSLEAAVLKASPLPYAGFEAVFSRDVILTFRPEDADDFGR